MRTRVASMAWLMVVTILLTINAEQFASASDSPPDAFLSLNVSSVHESDNNGSCFTLKNYFDAGFLPSAQKSWEKSADDQWILVVRAQDAMTKKISIIKRLFIKEKELAVLSRVVATEGDKVVADAAGYDASVSSSVLRSTLTEVMKQKSIAPIEGCFKESKSKKTTMGKGTKGGATKNIPNKEILILPLKHGEDVDGITVEDVYEYEKANGAVIQSFKRTAGSASIKNEDGEYTLLVKNATGDVVKYLFSIAGYPPNEKIEYYYVTVSISKNGNAESSEPYIEKIKKWSDSQKK